MSGTEFLLDCPGLRVTDLTIASDAVTIHVEPTTSVSTGPQCGTTAIRVHSRYPRTLADRPIHGAARFSE